MPDSTGAASYFPPHLLAGRGSGRDPGEEAEAPEAKCECWPWWWLLVAAAAGGGLGYYAGQRKQTGELEAGEGFDEF